MNNQDAVDVAPSSCVTAHVSQEAYRALVESGLCRGKQAMPCMRDDCDYCGSLNELIDQLGDECERRGCSLGRCVYDNPA